MLLLLLLLSITDLDRNISLRCYLLSVRSGTNDAESLCALLTNYTQIIHVPGHGLGHEVRALLVIVAIFKIPGLQVVSVNIFERANK